MFDCFWQSISHSPSGLFRVNKKSCFASSSSESAGFSSSLSATGGMLGWRSWISCVYSNLLSWGHYWQLGLFSPENKMGYLPVLLHIDYLCFILSFDKRYVWRMFSGSRQIKNHQWLVTNFTRVFQPIPSWLNWPVTFNEPDLQHHRLRNTIHLTLKMTSAQVVETSVTNNSSFQKYPHLGDHTIQT